ncbi:putative tartrate transporter [Arthrobacter sp. Hiyo8]|nr:putative tartrate transporter [Arthrobacter sp. Hiyo8]
MSAVTTSTKEMLDSPVLKSAIRKAAFRLMPMLVILYVVSFLDRTNVGFAEAALGADKGVSAGRSRSVPVFSSSVTRSLKSPATCCSRRSARRSGSHASRSRGHRLGLLCVRTG